MSFIVSNVLTRPSLDVKYFMEVSWPMCVRSIQKFAAPGFVSANAVCRSGGLVMDTILVWETEQDYMNFVNQYGPAIAEEHQAYNLTNGILSITTYRTE